MRVRGLTASPLLRLGYDLRMDVKLTGRWKEFEEGLDPKAFAARLDREIRVAHERIGREIVGRIRRDIRAQRYAPNSPLTVILKGSSTPPVHLGDLFDAITYEHAPRTSSARAHLRVGVIKMRAGTKLVNIARILHDGAQIDVGAHPQVRRAVFAQVSKGLRADRVRALNTRQRASVLSAAGALGRRRSRPMTPRQRRAAFARSSPAGGSGSLIWTIPARPFIARPLTSPSLQGFARDTWAEAMRRALAP